MILFALFHAVLLTAGAEAIGPQWFGPSPANDYCYYVHGNTRLSFSDAREICKDVGAKLPQVTKENREAELAYWAGNADKIIHIKSGPYRWTAGIWIGYKDDDHPNGNFKSIYKPHEEMPWNYYFQQERTVFPNENVLFAVKFDNWKWASWADVPSRKLFVVCQKDTGCRTGDVPFGTILKTSDHEFLLECNDGAPKKRVTCKCPGKWSDQCPPNRPPTAIVAPYVPPPSIRTLARKPHCETLTSEMFYIDVLLQADPRVFNQRLGGPQANDAVEFSCADQASPIVGPTFWRCGRGRQWEALNKNRQPASWDYPSCRSDFG